MPLGVFGNVSDGAPGDLWGLDSDGDLILVELKKYPGKPRDDPFGRFHCLNMGLTTAPVIREKWRTRLDKELSYVPEARRLIDAGAKGAPRPAPGLLP